MSDHGHGATRSMGAIPDLCSRGGRSAAGDCYKKTKLRQDRRYDRQR